MEIWTRVLTVMQQALDPPSYCPSSEFSFGCIFSQYHTLKMSWVQGENMPPQCTHPRARVCFSGWMLARKQTNKQNHASASDLFGFLALENSMIPLVSFFFSSSIKEKRRKHPPKNPGTHIQRRLCFHFHTTVLHAMLGVGMTSCVPLNARSRKTFFIKSWTLSMCLGEKRAKYAEQGGRHALMTKKCHL